MTEISNQILTALREVLGYNNYSLHEPRFHGNEYLYLKDCLDSTFVSSVGEYVDKFEKYLAEYTGVRRAVAVVNGTAALHISLELSGVKENDEVLIPSLTFVATANAVHYLGAIPHFVDSSMSTLGVDPTSLRDWLAHISEFSGNDLINKQTGRRIKAIIVMHCFGHPCNIDELVSVANDFKITLIEDAAESLGSFYQSKHTGSFGKLGTLSFNGNKTITTGGGGAILTNDEALADRAKFLTTTAKERHKWKFIHNEVGYNYRLPNLNAALGCAQLEQLPNFLSSKRRLTELYINAFRNIKDVNLLTEPANCTSNYWLQTLILNKDSEYALDSILEVTNSCGFMTRPAWTPMHHLKPYQLCPRSPLPNVESLSRRIINLPSSSGIA